MSDHRGNECHVDPLDKPFDREALGDSMVVYLSVWGMGCPRCATRVNNGLLSVDGVLWSEVFLEQGVAAVIFDQKRVTHDDLIQAVFAAGNDGRHHYQAQVIMQKPTNRTIQVTS